MKRMITRALFVTTCMLAVQSLTAQWDAVWFDETNTFTYVARPANGVAYVTGIEPMEGGAYLMKTNNDGDTWETINFSEEGEPFAVYDIHFRDAQRGVVAGYKLLHQSLQRTMDAGATWQDITPDPASFEYLTTAYFVNDNLGFAASSNILYTTNDGGFNWTSQVEDFYIKDIIFLDDQVGYISGHGSITQEAVIMKTTDGGSSWEEILSQTDTDLFVSEFMKVDVIDENTLVTNMQFTNEIFITIDGGDTWTVLSPDEFYGVNDFDFTSSNSGHILSNEGQIWYTSDGGATWTMQYSTEWGMYGPLVYLYNLVIDGDVGFVTGSNGLIKKYTAGTNALEELGADAFEIYPNPMNSQSTLTITATPPEGGYAYTVNIIDSSGKLVLSQQPTSTGASVILNDLVFSPGIYTVMLQSGKEFKTRKLVVNR